MKRLLACAMTCLLSACGTPKEQAEQTVIALTPIIADFVSTVGGDRIQVTSLVPQGTDPHTFEPTMSTLRSVAYADLAFTNGLLLEDQKLRDTINANVPASTRVVELGESSVEHGAYHIALVEDASLNTIWLGLSVTGEPSSDIVTFRATKVTGPGTLSSFTTGTFGQPSTWIDSAGGSTDLQLPTNAHTHMSWGFTEPGIYELTLEAEISGEEQRSLGSTTLTFAVGVEPPADREVADAGHMDIAADPSGGFTLRGEVRGTNVTLDPSATVIAVPHTASTVVPPEPHWRFLGHAGDDVWILAQAVVGKHVHGEIDPHMWLDVHNAIAYVETIAAELSSLDPQGATEYEANAQAYIAELEQLDSWSTSVVATIPEANRKLVTTHDAYGYLASAYDLDVTGFVSPNPSLEPSVHELTVISRILDDIAVPAVFIEAYGASSSDQLRTLATGRDIAVCSLNGDVLNESTYIELMEANIRTLKTCLDPTSLPAWDMETETKVQP